MQTMPLNECHPFTQGLNLRLVLCCHHNLTTADGGFVLEIHIDQLIKAAQTKLTG